MNTKEKLIKEILAINRENKEFEMDEDPKLLLGTIDHYWENGIKGLKDMDMQELKQTLIAVSWEFGAFEKLGSDKPTDILEKMLDLLVAYCDVGKDLKKADREKLESLWEYIQTKLKEVKQ